MRRFPLAPSAKMNLQKSMMDFIFTPFITYWNRRVDKVIEKQIALNHSTQYGFVYKGENFTGTNKAMLRPPIERLRKEFIPEMDALIKERDQVTLYEQPLFKTVLCALMNMSNNPWDYFKMLPPEMHTPWEKHKNGLPKDYDSEVTQEQAIAFLTQHQVAFDVVRIRMVTNLILT